MYKTNERTPDGEPIAVDIEKLSAMLSCGKATARKIGAESGAEIRINRRVLYNVRKVQTYLDRMSF